MGGVTRTDPALGQWRQEGYLRVLKPTVGTPGAGVAMQLRVLGRRRQWQLGEGWAPNQWAVSTGQDRCALYCTVRVIRQGEGGQCLDREEKIATSNAKGTASRAPGGAGAADLGE